MASRQSSATNATTPRAARTLKGWLFRGAAWTVLLGLLVLGVAAGNGWRPWVESRPLRPPRSSVARVQDPLAVAARRAARSVVAIQTVGQANTRALGAGFVVEGGLIATNFHVVSAATEAQVRFRDGRIFAVSGYAAADAAHDLALLRLESPPDDLQPLALAESVPAIASELMAIGHPRGVEFVFVEGRLSQRVATDNLPEDGQRFVRKLATAAEEIRWLQHTATLAEGNSGGPLIDDAGRVVGVNTWINRADNINYAIDSAWLRKLLATTSEATQPLEQLARSDLQAALIVSRLSEARLEQLVAAAEAMQWLPADKPDYRVLSELAMAMTLAQLPQSSQGDKADQQRMHALQTAATRIESQLRSKASFGMPDQVTFVNEQASALLSQRNTGLFCFAEVLRVVEGDQGSRGMLLRLVGSEQTLFISLDGQLLRPQPGQVYGIFGANLRGEVVRYGDNPLKLLTAPVIVSRTLIEVTK